MYTLVYFSLCLRTPDNQVVRISNHEKGDSIIILVLVRIPRLQCIGQNLIMLVFWNRLTWTDQRRLRNIGEIIYVPVFRLTVDDFSDCYFRCCCSDFRYRSWLVRCFCCRYFCCYCCCSGCLSFPTEEALLVTAKPCQRCKSHRLRWLRPWRCWERFSLSWNDEAIRFRFLVGGSIRLIKQRFLSTTALNTKRL